MKTPISAKHGTNLALSSGVHENKCPNFAGDRFALHVTSLRTVKDNFQHERPLQHQHFRLWTHG